jgi:hypothetical protein
MPTQNQSVRNRLDDFGESITNVTVRGFFHELLEILANLGESVEVIAGPVDIRAEVSGTTICRLVPYRELIHIHVGEEPVWEVRVRNETGYLDAIDSILDVYLEVTAARATNESRLSRIAIVPR